MEPGAAAEQCPPQPFCLFLHKVVAARQDIQEVISAGRLDLVELVVLGLVSWAALHRPGIQDQSQAARVQRSWQC